MLLLLPLSLAAPPLPALPEPAPRPEPVDWVRSFSAQEVRSDGAGGGFVLASIPRVPGPLLLMDGVDLLAGRLVPDAHDFLIGRLSPDGVPLWGITFSAHSATIAAGPDSVTLLAECSRACGFEGEVPLEGGDGRFHTIAGRWSLDGEQVWSARLHGAAPVAAAVDEDGQLTGAFRFAGPWHTDVGVVTCPGGGAAAPAILQWDPAGELKWARPLCPSGDTGRRRIFDVHVSDGEIALAGEVWVTDGEPQRHGLVMLLDDHGEVRWSRFLSREDGASGAAWQVDMDDRGLVVLGSRTADGCEWSCSATLWSLGADGAMRWSRELPDRSGLGVDLSGDTVRFLGAHRDRDHRHDRPGGGYHGHEAVDLWVLDRTSGASTGTLPLPPLILQRWHRAAVDLSADHLLLSSTISDTFQWPTGDSHASRPLRTVLMRITLSPSDIPAASADTEATGSL